MSINQVNPTRFFQAYFEACAANDGQPPENLEDLLPWNLSQEQKDAWHYPEPFP